MCAWFELCVLDTRRIPHNLTFRQVLHRKSDNLDTNQNGQNGHQSNKGPFHKQICSVSTVVSTRRVFCECRKQPACCKGKSSLSSVIPAFRSLCDCQVFLESSCPCVCLFSFPVLSTEFQRRRKTLCMSFCTGSVHETFKFCFVCQTCWMDTLELASYDMRSAGRVLVAARIKPMDDWACIQCVCSRTHL